jgi:hypothetical protein
VHYRHTQVGHVTVVLVVAMVALAMGMAAWSGQAGPAIVGGLLLLVLAQFGSLTTTVDDEALELRMGMGVIRRRIPLRQIASVAVVRTSWIWGWGIRWTPHGWLWNVWGTRGVELRYLDGERFRVGTDEPERLAAAIQARIARV